MKNYCSGSRRYGAAMLAVCASLLFTSLQAEEWTDPSGNVWTVAVAGDDATITAVAPDKSDLPFELTIPSTVSNETVNAKVTAFAADAFANQTYLSGITIPETIAEIPAEAFVGCGRLERVTIEGEGLTAIGDHAFKGCFRLTEFTVPDSVTTLGVGAFSKCYALEEVTLGNGLTELPSGTVREDALFYSCKALTTVNIGTNVTTIGDIVFRDCVSLEGIEFPNSVTNIGSLVFYGCNNLAEVVLGTNLVEIQDFAFYGCVGLTEIELPDSLKRIGSSAFYGCESLKFVEIPANRDGLETELGDFAFSKCTGMKEAVFGETVKAIPDYGFYDCTQLVYATLTDGVETIGDFAFFQCAQLDEVLIPDTVSTIGMSAFGLSGITELEFGTNVATVSPYAFYGCSNLVEVTLPESLLTLGDYAFSGCFGLETATISTNKDGADIALGRGIFAGCESLESVALGDSVTSIPGGVGCTFAGAATMLDYESVDAATLSATFSCFSGGMFYDCLSLTEIDWGANVTEIGAAAFFGCESLERLTLPMKISSIGDFAFYDCISLKSATVKGDIDYLGDGAFGVCTALPFITFESVTMTTTPGVTPFLYNAEDFVVYGVKGSTGWSGIVGDDSMPASGKWCDVTFYLGEPCIVTLDPNGGTIENSNYKCFVGAMFGNPPEPDLEGYDFDGWFNEPAGGAKLLPGDVIPGDMTVYAHWTAGGFTTSAELVTSEDDAAACWSYVGNGEWRSGEIANFESSSIEKTVTGEGTLTFGWKVSSEENCDFLLFSVDGEIMGAISGDVDWESKTVKIPGSGNHTLRWTYSKDKNGKDGLDCAWIGGFDWTPGKVTTTAPEGNFKPFHDPAQPGGDSGSTTPAAPAKYVVTYVWNDGTGKSQSVTFTGDNQVLGSTFPSVSRDGYTLDGWFTAASGGVRVYASTPVTKNNTYFAHWTAEEEETGAILFSSKDIKADKAVSTLAPIQYSAYVVDFDGNTVGSVAIKVGRVSQRTKESKVTATLVATDTTQKLMYKGYVGKSGVARLTTSGSSVVMELKIGEDSISGMLGSDRYVYGSRTNFASKDPDRNAVANEVLAKWTGPVNIAWKTGALWNTLTATISTKGKVKVTGMLANGTKITAISQFTVGKDWGVVPVIVNKNASLGFSIWLKNDGTSAFVSEFSASVGKPSSLRSGSAFRVSKTASLWTKLLGPVMADYLPDGLAVGVSGGKWVLPKGGKVSFISGTDVVDTYKLGENPAGLRLTYAPKTGTFKGSFKVHYKLGGRVKAKSVKVTGVLVNGVGYGRGTLVGLGTVPVLVK